VDAVSVPALVEELTPAWLSAALDGPVTAVRSEPVGTGQIGTCHRLFLEGDGVPPTVLAKLPAVDPAARDLLAGAYRGEVRFYAEIAPTVAIRVPACHHAVMSDDTGDFVLLLEDLAPAVQGDQLGGCTPAQARDAVVNLAGLHGPRWCDPTLLDLEGLSLSGPDDAAMLAELYGPATEIFLAGLGDLLAPEDHGTLRDCVAVIESWSLARTERFGLVHGDYRLDNLLFPPDGPSVAVDWQTLSLGLPARDLAYVLGTGLSLADRRTHERDLVAAYHEALEGHGVAAYPAELAWDDYRFAMLQGPLVSVFGCAYGTRTERGDRMFAAMVTRACGAIRDLGTVELASRR
jgi:hypothetical protein